MDKQREDFEAWVREYGNYPRHPELKTSDGAYHYRHTESEWRAWQAAQLATAQTEAERLNMALHGYQVAIETTEESLKDRVALAMEVERLKAAGAVDCGHRPPCTECSDYAAPIPQPPAPSEAAREYMTGYSDAKEWAGATNQAQPSQAGLSDAEIDAIGYMLFSNTKGGPTILQARTLSRAIIVAMRMTKTDSPT